jgi:hypothetical protein
MGSFPLQCLGDTKDNGGRDATFTASPSLPPHLTDSMQRFEDNTDATASWATCAPR